jgi:hypothetical protein
LDHYWAPSLGNTASPGSIAAKGYGALCTGCEVPVSLFVLIVKYLGIAQRLHVHPLGCNPDALCAAVYIY